MKDNRYLFILALVISLLLALYNKATLPWFGAYVVLTYGGLIFADYMINAFLEEIDTILEYHKNKIKKEKS